MNNARPIMNLWCRQLVAALESEGCVTGLWTSIINAYFPISVNPVGGNRLGQKLLGAEVRTNNQQTRADLILYNTVARGDNVHLRPQIVFEAKGSNSGDSLQTALNQCKNWTQYQHVNDFSNGEVCFFIAAKGRYVKMQVARRQQGSNVPDTFTLEVAWNRNGAGDIIGFAGLDNAHFENGTNDGTMIDMSTAPGRDAVHAAMLRMRDQLAANNGAGAYSW